MKKKYRLLKSSDFEKVFKGRLRIKTSNLIFFYLPSRKGRENSNIKIGIVVPKKKWKRAIDRNYLKRILWSIHSNYDLDSFPNYLVVFLFNNFFLSKYKYKKVNFKELKKEVDKIYLIFSKRCS